MNLFELVFKQMRQRALSSWLTTLSVLLGVGLAISILIVQREANNIFGQTSYGFDVIVGAKGSPIQLVVNTVYHISTSPGTIPYSVFDKMEHDLSMRRLYRVAVPMGVGDSYKSLPLVGTLPRIFGFDDATGLPKKGYDANGRPLDGFLDPFASDDDVEGSGKERRDAVWEYKPGKKLIMAAGHPFARDKFQAVIGADVSKLAGLKMGDTFQATHGFPAPNQPADIHKPVWTVVGVLEPTHSANDKCIFIPLTSFYCIAEHETGLVAINAVREGVSADLAIKQFQAEMKTQREEHQEKDATTKPATATATAMASAATAPAAQGSRGDEEKENYIVRPDGTIDLLLPKEVWGLSAIMVKARSGALVESLKYVFNNGRDAAASNPASVMREFFSNFIDNYSYILLVVSGLVTVVAGIGILVSIYNSVTARMKEIAILRALGATRAKVLTLICMEAGMIGLIGGVLGVLAGHAVAGVGSTILEKLLGQGIAWARFGWQEGLYLVGVVVLAVLAGLVPALKAYRVPVATNLNA